MKSQIRIAASQPTQTAIIPAGGILQRKCACGGTPTAGGECDECRNKRLQRRSTNQTELSDVPPIVHEVLRSPGQPLGVTTRTFMETRFGHDFSQVRVHTGSRASASAQAVGALAFTVGSQIVFGRNQYAAETEAARKLLAHELTHVVQQRGAAEELSQPLEVGAPQSAAEQEAERHSNSVAEAQMPGQIPTVAPHSPLLQRQSLGSGRGGSDDEGALLWESYRESITLDHFDSDKAILKPDHLAQLKEYKERFQTLLGRYPDSFVSVIGHTDATDTEAHNKVLGQERADAVKGELTAGDNALPTGIVNAGSLGESSLAVETKVREARNRRVEIIPRLRRFLKLPPPTPPQPWQSGVTGGTKKSEGIGEQGTSKSEEWPKIPDFSLPEKNWLEEGLKKHPGIKELPKWARDKVIDALKDGDEMLAEKVIDGLPLDDKVKAAVQAAVKSVLQLPKGKKFKMPEAPLRQPDFGPTQEFPKFPGQVLFSPLKIPF